MKDLPLNALQVFAVVCTHGGVRHAARELGIAHSSVSRHLAELESWLGVPIVERGGARNVWTPTPQAVALARAVQSGLNDIEHAVAAMREERSSFSVTIGVAPSVASRWLLPRLLHFESSHPRVELSVQVNQRTEDLAASGIDLALRMGDGDWPDVHCEALMDDALFPVMSPSFWIISGRPSTIDKLDQLRLLHDRDPNAGWDAWYTVHGFANARPGKGPRFTSSDLILRAAEQGQGVALARRRLAEESIESGLLVRPFGELDVPLAKAYWIVRPTQPAKPRFAVATVISWLKDQARR